MRSAEGGVSRGGSSKLDAWSHANLCMFPSVFCKLCSLASMWGLEWRLYYDGGMTAPIRSSGWPGAALVRGSQWRLGACPKARVSIGHEGAREFPAGNWLHYTSANSLSNVVRGSWTSRRANEHWLLRCVVDVVDERRSYTLMLDQRCMNPGRIDDCRNAQTRSIG